MIAAITTYPHEVVRTRMRGERTTRGADVQYKRMIQSVLMIARNEGRMGLYGGMGAHLLRTVPNAAILFVVVEAISTI